MDGSEVCSEWRFADERAIVRLDILSQTLDTLVDTRNISNDCLRSDQVCPLFQRCRESEWCRGEKQAAQQRAKDGCHVLLSFGFTGL